MDRRDDRAASEEVANQLAYSIIDGRIEWETEPVEISADEAFLPVRKARSPDALKKATEWLREKLGDGEWQMVADIDKEAKQKGITQITLKRAKSSLDIEFNRIGTTRIWRCRIPNDIAQLVTGSS